MIRTRQSARKSTKDLDDVIYESEFSEYSEHSSDEDSDYGNSRKKGKGPPAKRAKKGSDAAPAKQSSAKGSKQKKSLSLLPTMPLDVLFEVFSHLTPKDIIHLSRTSRIFRDTLMTRNAISVWKAARKRCGAPECPPIMNEPQWAVLLFGNLCQNCGAKNVSKPDFFLLRRVCINCKKNNYLAECKFKTRYPDVDPEVLELIPYTKHGAWGSDGACFFWTSDIDTMLLKLAEYEHNIHFRRPGAQQALKDFKDQQNEVVEFIHKSMRESERWYDQLALGRSKEREAVIFQRFESIRSKFIEMGYTKSDVKCIRSNHECQQPTLLTDRIWNRICPILEPLVLERKRERLEREIGEIRSARRAIIDTSYQEYQKTLMPSQWKYLPQTVDICAMDPFAVVVDAEPDVSVTSADLEDAFRQLPELISADLHARKLHARSLLKNLTSANQPACSAPESGEIADGEASSFSNSLPPNALDLATAVFKCRERSCRVSFLFGWDDIAQHHCNLDLHSNDPSWTPHHVKYKPGLPKLEFSAPGTEITAAVVRAVGLNDKVATVSDMDAKTEDIRFGCSICPAVPVRRNGTLNKGGYKWRELVLHCYVGLHSPHDALTVLSPDVVAKVKESEMTSPYRSGSQWTCGHCTVHLGNLKLRENVVEHLKLVHEIDSPLEPEDLFLFTRNPSLDTAANYPVDASPSTTSVKYIRCLECAGGTPSQQSRLFNFHGVKSHLLAKHDVALPEARIHYG